MQYLAVMIKDLGQVADEINRQVASLKRVGGLYLIIAATALGLTAEQEGDEQ